MKYLNYLDLGFQTLILGIVALASIGTALTGHFEAIGMVALYGAVLLGPWQMVSSLLTVISRGLYLKWRVVHLLSGIGYIVILSLFAAFFANAEIGGILKGLLWTFGFGIPAGLALFYYYITFKSFQYARTQAKAAV